MLNRLVEIIVRKITVIAVGALLLSMMLFDTDNPNWMILLVGFFAAAFGVLVPGLLEGFLKGYNKHDGSDDD